MTTLTMSESIMCEYHQLIINNASYANEATMETGLLTTVIYILLAFIKCLQTEASTGTSTCLPRKTVTLNTPNKYQYLPLVPTRTSFVFSVKAANDAHVLLHQRADDTTTDIYEIVIGGWANTKSVIRNVQQQRPPLASARTVGILSATEFRTFWVSWDDNRVKLGRGAVVGQHEVMVYFDTHFTPVNFVSVSTGWGATGDWRHEVATSATLDTPNLYRYVPLKIEGQDSYVFSVKATNDAHILLHQRKNDVKRDIYEIVLGGWANTKSVIRNVQQQRPPLTQASTRGILSGNEGRIFWVSSQDKTIQVGRGSLIGQNVIMSYYDPNFTPVNFISVSTGWGATGQWRYSYSKTVALSTPNRYHYVPLPELDLGKIEAKTSIVFRVKASNDAHLLLHKRQYDTVNDIYEVVLGGWANTQSVLRKRQQQRPPLASAATRGLLSSTEFRTFWASWEFNTIRVGRGSVVGADIIMQYYDPSFTPVNFVSASTGWGATGVWKYDVCSDV